MPEPPGSQGDEPKPAGTALAPPAVSHRPASFYVSEIRHECNRKWDNCQAVVSVFV